MKNKYHNKKVTVGGITFDSVKEARRYSELILLQRAGKIKDLRRQVRFELIPKQYRYYERFGKRGKRLKDGRKLMERNCVYVADFTYTEANTNEYIVEDVKGRRTKDYIIKRKLMLFLKGIRIKET